MKIFIDPDECWRRQVYFDAEVDIVPSHWFDEEGDYSLKSLDAESDNKDILKSDEGEEEKPANINHDIEDDTRKCKTKQEKHVKIKVGLDIKNDEDTLKYDKARESLADDIDCMDNDARKSYKKKKGRLFKNRRGKEQDEKDTLKYHESEEVKPAETLKNIGDDTQKYVKNKVKLDGAFVDAKMEQLGTTKTASGKRTKASDSKNKSPVKPKPRKIYNTIINCVFQLVLGHVADGRIKSPRKAIGVPNTDTEDSVEIAEDALERLPLNVSEIRKNFMARIKSEGSDQRVDSNVDTKTETRQANKYSGAASYKSGKVKALSAIFDKGKHDELATLGPLQKGIIKERRQRTRLTG